MLEAECKIELENKLLQRKKYLTLFSFYPGLGNPFEANAPLKEKSGN